MKKTPFATLKERDMKKHMRQLALAMDQLFETALGSPAGKAL